MRAVVFDLFGTLVPELGRSSFYEIVREMADGLGCDVEAFQQEWSRTAVARQTGAYTDGIEGNVRAICVALGAPAPDDASLAGALAPRAAMYERWFHPRDGALETLRELRARGVLVALISMCAPDTPPMWRASELAPFVDVAVFSSEVGMRKPDPEIYLLACEMLGVEPADCVYVGDGAYGELTGAAAVGMTPYLLRDPDLDHEEMLVTDRDDWTGPSIAHLSDVLGLF